MELVLSAGTAVAVNLEDLLIKASFFYDKVYCEILNNAPAGLFDNRFWCYWHFRVDFIA